MAYLFQAQLVQASTRAILPLAVLHHLTAPHRLPATLAQLAQQPARAPPRVARQLLAVLARPAALAVILVRLAVTLPQQERVAMAQEFSVRERGADEHLLSLYSFAISFSLNKHLHDLQNGPRWWGSMTIILGHFLLVSMPRMYS